MLFIGVSAAVISAYILIPDFGVLGAAWSSVIGAITLGIIAVIISGEFTTDVTLSESE